mmetsp:Transcript_818/g.1260  ORF Transcript_818/g.1260 Transcript_818/m.1260 type:complete len:90 (-) Transcript_818:55-324(-)
MIEEVVARVEMGRHAKFAIFVQVVHADAIPGLLYIIVFSTKMKRQLFWLELKLLQKQSLWSQMNLFTDTWTKHSQRRGLKMLPGNTTDS